VARNTIEEKILALQKKKQSLAANLIQSTSGIASSVLSKEDLYELFSN